MARSLALALTLLLAVPGLARAADCVVLLHGLGRSEVSFLVMEEMLGAVGFRMVNLGYPSTEATVEGLLEHVDTSVEACGADRVNFVTHSMGGILARGWLALNRPANMGRVVMLAPPNQGSEVVDAFAGLVIFEALTGPVGRELGTGAEGIAGRLPPVDFELGVIAGSPATARLTRCSPACSRAQTTARSRSRAPASRAWRTTSSCPRPIPS